MFLERDSRFREPTPQLTPHYLQHAYVLVLLLIETTPSTTPNDT